MAEALDVSGNISQESEVRIVASKEHLWASRFSMPANVDCWEYLPIASHSQQSIRYQNPNLSILSNGFLALFINTSFY